METIAGRIWALTEQLCIGLKEKGYHVFSSRRAGETSGIVSFTSATHNHAEVVSTLEKQRIIVVLREGRLRASPHFYNTAQEMARVLDALPGHG